MDIENRIEILSEDKEAYQLKERGLGQQIEK